MFQFFRQPPSFPPAPTRPSGAADAGGLRVTSAYPVPLFRWFPQWRRGFPRRGLRVTLGVPDRSALGMPLGECAQTRGRSPTRAHDATSLAETVSCVGTSRHTSSGSSQLTVLAGTSAGTPCSATETSSVWDSSPSCRGPLHTSRLRSRVRTSPVVKPRKWISKPPRSGSHSGRRQRPAFIPVQSPPETVATAGTLDDHATS